MLKIIFSTVLAIALGACNKVPDLDAPCREFGRYCPQQPINVEPLEQSLEHYQGEK